MPLKQKIFFCAVGGSGMLPLALVMKARGFEVCGSDRGRDQGRTPERFAWIEGHGITLFPQDGSGVTKDVTRVVASTAVEDTVPDIVAAKAAGIPVWKRAEALAEMFNAAPSSIAVAGTSGKSTTTGMIGWILHHAKRNPTIINGAVMKNFVTPEAPFASARVGDPDLFVAEVDESDGSIALFTPTVAVLNNIALDHKSMEELRALFGDFARKGQFVILNLDNAETAAMARVLPQDDLITYSLTDPEANLCAEEIIYEEQGSSFCVRANGFLTERVHLTVPGAHNISNALAAMGAAIAVGVDVVVVAEALNLFQGIGRRLDVIGKTPSGITVIDDFAHNPDKIKASLKTLHQKTGRVVVFFQPHGYGPLRLMHRELAEVFAEGLTPEDHLFLPDPLYLGGTTNKEIGSAELAAEITAKGGKVRHVPDRAACVEAVIAEVRAGDTIVVMGARDDTLPALAREMLERVLRMSGRVL